MQGRRFKTARWLILAGGLMATPGLGMAGDGIGPDIPEAVKGEECVEPTEVMRRDHMDFLMHHRDETVHQGIRTERYSLDECLECHVPPKTEKVVRIESQEHFCSSCHSYAAVKVDCFQCHAEQPSGKPEGDPSTHHLGQAMPHHSGERASDGQLGRDLSAILAAEEDMR